jgi:hypothetical protein
MKKQPKEIKQKSAIANLSKTSDRTHFQPSQFIETINLIWKFFHQPLFNYHLKFTINFAEFKQYQKELQFLENCLSFEFIEFLEYCWNLDNIPPENRRFK